MLFRSSRLAVFCSSFLFLISLGLVTDASEHYYQEVVDSQTVAEGVGETAPDDTPVEGFNAGAGNPFKLSPISANSSIPDWAQTGGSIPDAPLVNAGVPSGEDNVGALEGSGGVSGGAASYSISIAVVPGRKGMQPGVSLGYSSRGGNGIAGMGWSLSAGSSIHRCGATVAQDGFTASVQYSAANDRLCLDGQRLVKTNGSTYGTSGSVYRTELDSFAKVVQSGSINSPTSYFTVTFKDGKINKYGNTSQSRHKASGRSEVLTWAIENSIDRSGNTITYDYLNNGDGEYLLDKIHYTGRNGSDGDRHVEFKYQDRVDSNGATDYSSSYLAGGLTRQTKRLHKIYTKYQNTVVREYRLEYGDMSLSSGRTLLRSAQECAYKDGAGYCLPVTTFDWQEAAPQYTLEPLTFFNNAQPTVVGASERHVNRAVPHGDGNGDGVKDWPEHYVNAESEILSTHSEQLASCFKPGNSGDITCLAADFNSDGKTDLFKRDNNRLKIQYRGTSNWIDTGIKWADGLNDNPMAFTDINGDGWLDILFREWRNSKPQLWAVFHSQNVNAPYSGYNGAETNQRKNSQHQILYNYDWRDILTGPGAGTRLVESDIQLQGDMNGDGLPDFVTFTNKSFDEGNRGMPIPDEIELVTVDAAGTITLVDRQFTGRMEQPTDEIKANLFHDVNADGLTDWLAIEDSSKNLHFKLNTGTAFTSAWVDLNVQLPMRGGNYGSPTEPAFYRHPVMSKILVMDYNGDGRTEMLVADTVRASACVNIAGPGGGIKCDDNLYGNFQPSTYDSVMMNMNGGVLDDSVRNYKAIYFDEDANGNITASESVTSISASATQAMVLDATGDGLADVVTTFGCRGVCMWNGATSGQTGASQDGGLQEGTYINRNLGASDGSSRYEATDLMKSATNAFDLEHSWIYRPLSSDEYDQSGAEYYTPDHAAIPTSDTDHFHFASSMYVVAEHKTSNGIGGLNSTLYRYNGANYNNKGRGFQGFYSIVVENTVRGTKTRTDFHQIWPLSGQVQKTCSWLSTDSEATSNCSNAFAESSMTYLQKTGGQSGTTFVVPDTSNQFTRDLNTRVQYGSSTSTSSYDSYGNLTAQTTSSTDSFGTVSKQVTNSYDYSAASSWWLDKLDSTVSTSNPVTRTGGPSIATNTDLTKAVTTNYGWNNTHRLPSSVAVVGGATVTTTYNADGLPLTVTTSGTGVTSRAVTTTYTTDGYFAATVANAKGHTTSFVIDATHGQPTKVTDPNNLVTNTLYEAFGRVKYVQAPGMPKAYTRYWKCDGTPWCPTNAKYRVTNMQAGAPLSYAYLDQFNRPVRTLTRNFANTHYVQTFTEYYASGDTKFESRPWDSVSGEPWRRGTSYDSYDELGRLTQKSVNQAMGDLFTTTYVHNGLTTTIDAEGLMMERTYNSMNQLMQTKDAIGGYTKYAYDGAGNPIVLQDAVGNKITAKYDALGRKEYVDDPNMGHKDFVYNAFNELSSETDANGNTIAYTYDELGRIRTRRVNGDLEGNFIYDLTNSTKGLGLLAYEDNYRPGDGTKHRKYYYYTDSSTGRKVPYLVRHRFYEGNASNYTDYLLETYWDDNYGRPKGMKFPSGLRVAYEYNSWGYQTKIKNPASGYVYKEINEMDAWGNVLEADVANGLVTEEAVHYQNTSQMASIKATKSNGIKLHHTTYDLYDVYGNIKSQTLGTGNLTNETFIYDDLHRLTQSTRTGTTPVNYGYDAIGNLTSKSDYATGYTYTGAGNCNNKPNAVCQVNKIGGGGTINITYDANGNMKSVDGKTLDYNAFNKPTSVTKGSVTSTFNYGSDLMRYKQVKTGVPGGTETTLYLDKAVEMITQGSETKIRQYIGDTAIVEQVQSNAPVDSYNISFLHKDRLGSIATITDHNGAVKEQKGFDPFGKPRDDDWMDLSNPILASDYTDRGFTGHEHLDDAQLIHMNGRAYDYNLGRFLSVDPYVHGESSEGLNPYSYIMNNPLAGIDPNGYIPVGSDGEPLRKVEETTEVTVKYRDSGSRINRTKKVKATRHENGDITLAGKNSNGFERSVRLPRSNSNGGSSPSSIGSPASIASGDNDTTSYNASGFGSIDFSTEGTAEEREQRFSEAKGAIAKDERNIEFDDRYAIWRRTGDKDIGAEYFNDAEAAKEFIRSAPVGESRTWLHGINHDHKIHYFLGAEVRRSDKITLYRTATMGFTGAYDFPNNMNLNGYWSARNHLLLTLGHEIGHRRGLDRGDNGNPHRKANLHGLRACLSAGGCNEFE